MTYLRAISHQLPHPRIRQRHPAHKHLTRRRLHVTRQDPKSGALARPVDPQQSEALTSLTGKGHITYSMLCSTAKQQARGVALAQSADQQCGRVGLRVDEGYQDKECGVVWCGVVW